MMKLKDLWEKRKVVWNFIKNPIVTAIFGFIIALLLSTQIHTANVNLQHYFAGNHFFGEWSDFDVEINRVQENYNDRNNFTFDVILSNHWLETRTAHVKISIDSSSNKINCISEEQSCDEMYFQIPPNVQEKKVTRPTILIGDFIAGDSATDGYKLCVDVIDDNNKKHNIQECKVFHILDR